MTIPCSVLMNSRDSFIKATVPKDSPKTTHYDTDCGHNKSLSKTCASSPIRYSKMRKHQPSRKRRSKPVSADFSLTNGANAAHQKTIMHRSSSSPVAYSWKKTGLQPPHSRLNWGARKKTFHDDDSFPIVSKMMSPEVLAIHQLVLYITNNFSLILV